MADSNLPKFGEKKPDAKSTFNQNDLFSSLADLEEDEDENEINKYLLINTKKNKIDHEKNIQNKLSKLYMRMRYAQHKYHDIRRHFTHIGIAIMSISFILTLLEAFRNTMDLNEIANKNIRNFILLIPLILSSLVSFLTALIKFNKYEERIEALIKANEKSIFTISEMKKIREALYLSNTEEELDTILNDFQKNIYPKYLENNVDIERLLTDNDYSKYMDIVNEMDIEYCRKEKIKQKILQSIKDENDGELESLEIELESLKVDRTELCCC